MKNWQQILKELQAAGWTGDDIVRECRVRGLKISTAKISRLKNGVTMVMSWELGEALLAIRREKCAPRMKLRGDERP